MIEFHMEFYHRVGWRRAVRHMATLLIFLFCVTYTVSALRFVKNSYQTLPEYMTFRLLSDFGMRYNEAKCVSEGIDPFDIWRGTVKDARFTPWDIDKVNSPDVDFERFVHAYPPWEYTCMIPFVALDRRYAQYVFFGLMLAGLLVLSCGWFCVGFRLSGKVCVGLLLLAAVWSQASPITSCLAYGNYGILIALSVSVAIYCHANHKDALAGFFWFVAMVKPQMAAIFFIPLLVMRKWKTLLTVGSLLVVATLIPSILCQRSCLDLITCMSEYSAGQFSETGFIGKPIFVSLVEDGGISPTLLSGMSAFVGSLVCGICTMMLWRRDERCETLAILKAFVPALILSTVWTNSRIHDFCIQGISSALLLLVGIKAKEYRAKVASIALALLASQMFRDKYCLQPINVWMLISVVVMVAFCYCCYRSADCCGENQVCA